MTTKATIRLCVAFVLFVALATPTKAEYQIGIGIADSTGPAAGVIFMGYAKLSQKGTGLHLRQFARAYIIGDDTNRFVFVSVDMAMIGYGMREAVIENLQELYGNLYNIQNVIISGSHTHSTPGGFMEHFMFDVTCLGFVRQTFNGYVSGITQAIINAHNNIQSGRIYLNSGTLLDSNINRSPASYEMNPESEKAEYEYNVDKTMVQLKFTNMNDEVIGLLHWFAVHPVSMSNSNTLVSSDNVGYASILMEKLLNDGAFPGKGSIVTAFASTNLGDVSPNTRGPSCTNTGAACDLVTSTCNGDAQYCVATGPGEDMFESTKIIAENLYTKALELLDDGNAVEVTGAVKIVHQFIDMPTQTAEYELGDGTTITGQGCNAAMGYSFAAGTTDGPGEFDFTQGTTTNSFLWDLIRNLLAPPSEADVSCHAPKPILLATGQMYDPYEWQPRVVSTQLALIGNVALAAVPGEFTTMSGRRLRKAIKSVIGDDTTVVIAGLSNHYTDYIATYEEYQLQRYEGASTVYGPHTLGIYLSQYKRLAQALVSDVAIDPGAEPYKFNRSRLFSIVVPVFLDHPDLDKAYGRCTLQPSSGVSAGSTVTAKFVAGHPRNNLMHGETFLTVERLGEDGEWTVVATDAVWETRFSWARTYLLASEVTIEWEIPSDTTPGSYRIRHFGYARSLFGRSAAYEGSSNTFQVV